jgi:hypothetical protein
VGLFINAKYSGINLSKRRSSDGIYKKFTISTQKEKEHRLTSKNFDELCEI